MRQRCKTEIGEVTKEVRVEEVIIYREGSRWQLGKCR